mmetsp:Transcript_2840/g.4306  ORF Transcript_2840/g.4306 Transcript_2840/m.4306 type:complete len:82 (+) Transcript_2840:2079-2324(+)
MTGKNALQAMKIVLKWKWKWKMTQLMITKMTITMMRKNGSLRRSEPNMQNRANVFMRTSKRSLTSDVAGRLFLKTLTIVVL